MSNSVFQSVIVQLRDVSDRVFGVIDTEGCVISCTDMSVLGERWTDAALKVGNEWNMVLVGIIHKKTKSFCSKMSKGTCNVRKRCV